MTVTAAPSVLSADVTYWLDSSVPGDVAASVQEAVAIYNKYGSFNKHLTVYFNTGVPTAQANYDGVITFGGSRNTRVALHEMGHTMGIGTYWRYGELMSGGVWQGPYGRNLGIEMGGYADGVHGDGTHIWPWGLNYDDEDSFTERIKHVRIMAAMRCDMGIMAYSREAEHQVVPLGGTAQFTVQSPLAGSYRWYRDGAALSNGGRISGATEATLQIADVQPADVGTYHCAATGAGENLNSRPRRLLIQEFVGHWNFDGNSLDGLNANNGIPTGSPAYAAGKIGKAIDLDGADDFVTLPEDVSMAEDMTLAAWVYWDGGSQWQRIFDFGTSTSQNLFLTPRSGSNTLRFAIKNGGDEQIVETSQLAVGQWVHAAVILRDDVAVLYVNGKPVDTNPDVTIDPVDFEADRNYIGKSQWPDPLFNGRVDDFRVYNFALSGSDIWDIWGQSPDQPPVFQDDSIRLPEAPQQQAFTAPSMADYADDPDGDPLTFSKISGPAWLQVAADGSLAGTPGPSDGGENRFWIRVEDPAGASDDIELRIRVIGLPASHYRFDNNADDSAGTAHAVVSGTPAYTTGILGQAVDLDGTGDYVTLPAGRVNADDITLAAWIYWDGGGQWQRIFDFGNNTSQYMFLTPASGSGTLRFAVTTAGNGSEQRLETAGLAVGQWVHVAVTLDGNTGRLYVNGQLRDTNSSITIDPADFNPAVNYIGKSQWPDPLFNGRVDEFRIYHYALPADEIAVLSQAPAFTADPIVNSDAVENRPYAGQSLTDFVAWPDSPGGLTFRKNTGPGWLSVETGGALSGTPADADVGHNTFTVRVENAAGLFSTAEMTIHAANVYSGVRGIEDLAGLAARWLMADCTDIPPCGGADLSDDGRVDWTDFSKLSQNWRP